MADSKTPTTAATKPVVLDTASAEKAAPDSATMPPAGDARREEMKKRHDDLQRQMADFEKEFSAELGSVDPAKLKQTDNEICQAFDPTTKMLEVSNAQSGRVYLWEQADIYNRWGGFWVTGRKAQGWKLVSGDSPEAREHKHVDGTRRVGDAVLMWIERERYEEIERVDRRRRLAIQQGVSVKVLEDAERAGVRLHDLEDASTPDHIRQFARAQAAAATAARQTMVSSMRQAGRSGASRVMASELANRRLEAAIRSGSVPGLTPGR